MRSGAGQFVFSKPIKILGDSSAAVMDFEDNSDPNNKITKTLTYDKAAGTDGAGAFVFGDQIEVPASSPAYMTFKTTTGERYAWKMNPDVSPITLSMVKFASAGGAETELFRFAADGSFGVQDPGGTIRNIIASGGKMNQQFQNLIRGGSFESIKPTGWETIQSGTFGTKVTLVSAANDAKFGSKALAIQDDTATAGGEGIKATVPSFYRDQLKGKQATISGWARTDAGQARASVGVSFDSGTTINVKNVPSNATPQTYLTTTYQQFFVTFTVPTTTTTMLLYLYGAEGTEPTTVVGANKTDNDGAGSTYTATKIYFDGLTMVEGAMALDYGPSPIFDTGDQVIFGNLAIGANADPYTANSTAMLIFGEPDSSFGTGYGGYGMGTGMIRFEKWGSNAGGQFFFNRGIRFTPEGGQAFGATLSVMNDPSTTYTSEGLIHLGNSSLVSGSSGGTFISMSPPSGFTGDFLSFERGGTAKFKIDKDGKMTAGDVPWARLSAFPSACPDGQVVKGIGGSLSCVPDATGGQNLYDRVTDGTTTAQAANSADILKFRTASNLLSVAVGSNDATHGDNVLFTVNQGNIDHGAISCLADDDHTQYALLAGRSGGQTFKGGTAATENLTLESTANASKGVIVALDPLRVSSNAIQSASNAADQTITVSNPDASGKANLSIEGNLTVNGSTVTLPNNSVTGGMINESSLVLTNLVDDDDLQDGAVDGGVGGEIADNTITNDDIKTTAAIATSKLSGAVTSIASHGLGSLATASAVSGGVGGTITDDTIINDDIKTTAAIAKSKISTSGTWAAADLPSDGYASTYVNASGDTMTGNLALPTSGVISAYGGIGPYENLLKYSDDFTQADWARSTGVGAVTTTTNTAPNGTATADTVPAGDDANDTIAQVTGTGAASTQFTGSVWLKVASGNPTITLSVDSNGGTAA
ncbi:MAG TPA: hypothetical protein DDX89_08645, partial [Candidatus Omnitrophica bacterium]|nr:hypothetical protein [Candidatus Omnitrophota bacterium]